MSRSRAHRAQTRYEPRRTINHTLTWYVVQSVPQVERKAADALALAGADVWLPRFTAITMRRRKKVELDRLFFPGYLFAGLPSRDHTGILFGCEHVSDVLGVDGPLAVPSGLVQVIADRLTGDVKSERMAAAALFRVGELRSVTQGPFQGFLAQVTELLLNGRVKTNVAMFGRQTPVEFDPSWLGVA